MSVPSPSEESILAAALQIPGIEQRARFLDQVCNDDAGLRQRIADRLNADDGVKTELNAAVAAPDAGPNSPGSRSSTPGWGGALVAEAPGVRIGRYKLLQQIGEGGCGTVFMAEQEEPVRRRVALKVIKLGMDTKSVVARFEAERQALAMMDHPNIAKVLDAGTTDSGRPFFVMELVRGIPITRYCDENKLPIPQRLELFIRICGAIQHAHHKGIIHRDIKPSNILVTLHDGRPEPKVIDFGIAKATEGRLTDRTLFTAYEQFIGTPAYMSPEQAAMSGLDVDTRSDIYSLGVLLYELLTGRTPFDARELAEAGFDEVRRRIQDVEPPCPSNRLSTLGGEALTTTAHAHGTEALKLVSSIRGDLDWIVMKCLEKDRTRRYETANGLAADLRRFLGQEPVLARPPSTAYRLQKAVRRNRLAFAAAAAVFAALTLGLALTTWQAIRARREAARAMKAEAEAQRRLQDSEAISKFLAEVFRSPDPQRDGRNITVAETLSAAAKKIDKDLADQPDRQAQLRSTLAMTLYGLGLYPEAIDLQEKVRDHLRLRLGPNHPDTLQALQLLAEYYWIAQRTPEAIQLGEDILHQYRERLGVEHTNTLEVMNNLALAYWDADRVEEALRLLEEVLPLRRKINGRDHPKTLQVINNVGVMWGTLNETSKAIPLFEELLPLTTKTLGREHPETLSLMSNLGAIYELAGRNADSLPLLEEAARLSQKVLGPNHPATMACTTSLSDGYSVMGRRDEAAKLLEALADTSRRINAKDPPKLADQLARVAFSFERLGEFDRSILLLQEAIGISPDTLNNAYFVLIRALILRERYPEALQVIPKAMDHFAGNPGRLQQVTEFGQLAQAASGPEGLKSAQAQRYLREYLERERRLAVDHPNDSGPLHRLARFHLWQGETNAALELGQRLVTLAGTSRDETLLERAATTVLLVPRSNPDLWAPGIAAARRASEVSQGRNPWANLAQCLADYREGRFAEVDSGAARVLGSAADNNPLRGQAVALRAMARWQRGQQEQARADLAEVQLRLPRSRYRTPLVPAILQDNEIAMILLYEEAAGLIRAASPVP